jgi:murein DD-endopeptidase MepM/ murein hydrolase activator NlpD
MRPNHCLRSRFRLTVAGLLGVALTFGAASASLAVPASDADLQRLSEVMDRLELAYGSRVDEVDAQRLADKFQLDTGSRIDRDDVERMQSIAEDRIEIADRLLPWFDRLKMGYGTVVDPGDSLNLATYVGASVGQAVDPGDVDAVEEAAAYEVAHPTFALVTSPAGAIRLREPSDRIEVIGYHQSNHDGAQQMASRGDLGVTMEDRNRDTASRGSADIAVPQETPIHAPVTGTVLRSGTYTLYCDYADDYAVIEPDGLPGWELKILHIDGVQVAKGDRVTAGVTLIAPRATMLPFRSQVNDHTQEQDTPHVHVEVIDTSIPDRPSSGGGC